MFRFVLLSTSNLVIQGVPFQSNCTDIDVGKQGSEMRGTTCCA